MRSLQLAFPRFRGVGSGLLRQCAPAYIDTVGYLKTVLRTCRQLEAVPTSARKRLWGVPFAVKDNIDVACFPTTAACPAFRYMPARSAPVVQALLDAGALVCCTLILIVTCCCLFAALLTVTAVAWPT